MDKVYKLGLDIGSTTIKVVLLDGEKIIHSDYQRHHSDVSGLLYSDITSFSCTPYFSYYTGS